MTEFNHMTREELIAELVDKSAAVSELEKYRALFNNSPEAIMFSTLEGKLLDCNDRACALYGYSRDEMRALPLWELWTYEHISRFPERIIEEQKNGGLNACETHKKKGGVEFPVEVFTRLIDVDGEVFRWSVVHNLSTIKRHAGNPIMGDDAVSDMMKLLPELIGEPDFVLETNLNGVITSANRMFYSKTGYDEEDVNGGLNVADLFPPEFRESVADTTKRILAGELQEIRERTFVGKDGVEIPVLVYSSPVDESGEITGTRLFAIDTTGHKQMEDEMLNMEKFHALGQVSGGVMHDLNNILSIILGYTELFSQKALHSSDSRLWEDIMEKIRLAAIDGTQMLKRVRNFSKLDGVQPYTALYVNTMIDEVLDMLEPKFSERHRHGGNIAVMKDLSPVPCITGNDAEFREVLSNLMINAIEAMPHGGTLTISTSVEHGNVFIGISDTGTGMTEQTKASLFKPFFTTKGRKGTGLGLYISRNILIKLGGELLCESTAGEGTTFRLIVPASEHPREPDCEDDSILPRAPDNPHPASDLRILVVDDEPSICDILREYFGMAGYAVETTSSGKKGIELFEAGRHDIVITDLNMPDYSGLDIARGVKKISPDTTVIMITGSFSGLEEMGRFTMIDHILPKPIEFEKLSTLITSLEKR